MPRSPAQSDFVVYAAPSASEVDVIVELPQSAQVVELPRAIVRTDEASPRATRWVMGFTWVVLAALVLLCAIGPHLPSGE